MIAGTAPSGEAPVDVLVCTFNSAAHLTEVLEAARRCLPIHRLIVVDRHSTDRTVEIATSFGAEVHVEEVGLGYARRRAVELAETPQVLFLDSDVVIRRPDFLARARAQLARPGTAAVVGCAVGHPFLYGLPLSLTLFDRSWILRVRIPPGVQGRETYYIQRQVREEHRRVRYVPEAFEHFGTYRSSPHWPEWQGAWVRITGGVSVRELLYSGLVVALLLLNSRRLRNIAYAPVFYLKLVRGFMAPQRWREMDRRRAAG
ncbi:MAG TPA: glycosyltransferase family A protein [Thermoplasmata archaeon]|nr:glycosyltransferase family A protein [Thermoplasmata archaeon]